MRAAERRSAEEALRESEARYRTLVEAAREIICTVALDGRFTSFNAAFTSLTGWSAGEWIGRPFSELVPAEDLDACTSAFEIALRGGIGPSVRHRVRTRDGGCLSVESTGAPLLRGGRVEGVLGLVRDVTDRVQAEEELRRSRRRLEEAEEVGHVGCWEWDLVTGRLTWTAEMYRLFGVSPQDFVPLYATSLERVHPDDRLYVDEVCRMAVQEGRGYAWDARILRPSGEVRFIHSRGHAVAGADGALIRMIGIAQDVTDRVRDEQTRRDLMQRLISIHEEERARLSRELHDGTGQALAALLVGLRHVEDATSLKAVRLAAARQRELVAQTLDEVGRLARGLRPTALDDLGLVAALERHVADQGWLFGMGVTLDAKDLGRGRLPRAVETALYRAAQEAMANAGRHAQARQVRIRLERVGPSVRLTVTDDGRGFDVERALLAPGHLGLHTIRERAELLGGRAEIGSGPGRGTTVTLTVPLPAAVPAARPVARARTAARTRKAGRR